MTPDEEKRRGDAAAMILDNPLYQEAFLVLRGQMMEAFQKTSFEQSSERDEIWRTMKCLDGLEAQLSVIMTTGRLSSATEEMHGAPH